MQTTTAVEMEVIYLDEKYCRGKISIGLLRV